MVYAFGTPGSGASTAPVATTAANALSFRLVWTGTPTMRNLSNVGVSGHQYNLGGQVLLTMNGSPGQLYVMAAGDAYQPVPIPIPGWAGNLLITNPVVFDGNLLDPTGAATFTFNLPTNPALVGFHIFYQGATIDPFTGAITLTNGTDHFLNS
jgi:hypothetical protein